MTGWALVIVAGIMEVVWAASMAHSQGFTRLWPSVLMVLAIAGSMGLMVLALRTVPLGTGYAVWTGIGAAGTFLYGIVALGEPADAARIACVVLIVAGIIGLRLFSP